LRPFCEFSHLLLSAAEAQLECAKNIDIYRAGCIISLCGPLLKYKTGHQRASGIGKPLRRKKVSKKD